MGAPKKLGKPVYVTTVLEESQHEALKYIAYRKHKPMAELIREAIERFIADEDVLKKEMKRLAASAR